MLEYLRSQPDKVDVDESVVATNKLYNQSVLTHTCMMMVHTYVCVLYSTVLMVIDHMYVHVWTLLLYYSGLRGTSLMRIVSEVPIVLYVLLCTNQINH